MPITSTGIGSGLDVEGLVAQLVLAEIQPKEVRLARQETTYQTEISSYGFIKSALSDFQTAVKTVADASTYQSNPSRSATTPSSMRRRLLALQTPLTT